jgi:hypothetical protein
MYPFEVLIPILVPTALFFSIAAVLILRGPLGKALGERIAARREAAETSPELERLNLELSELRERVTELEERLDFAERMLVDRVDRPRLGGEG